MGVHNDEEYLRDAIDSILSQSFEDFEFLVVDDASTDASTEIIQSYDDPRLRLLSNEDNKGLTRSLNEALEVARGTYIARQDADDRSHPDRLRRQVESMETHPDVAVLGTGVEIIDTEGNRINRRRVLTTPSLEDLQLKNHVIHGSVLMRRDAVEDVGGYDELFRYSQDYDLWLRLAKTYKIRNLRDPLYSLRLHDESVYFARKEQSLLYALLARGRSTGEFGAETVDYIRRTNINSLKNELSEAQRREFHTRLATVYLRYGHPEQAREESSRGMALSKGISSAYLTYAFTYFPPCLLTELHNGVRLALNAKVFMRNTLTDYLTGLGWS